jgi:hypothetical protein
LLAVAFIAVVRASMYDPSGSWVVKELRGQKSIKLPIQLNVLYVDTLFGGNN